MQIVEFSSEYKEKIIELIIAVAVNEHGFYQWENAILKFENELYKHNNGNCWIALNDNDEVVGTISLRKIDSNRAEIKSLYIHSNFRRQGIAQSLLDNLIKFSIEKQYLELHLDTYDKFGNAIKLYEKNGFIKQKTIDKKHIYVKNLEK